MLTGDNERTARAVAEKLGIDEVEAGVAPQRKNERIRQLREKDGAVAMAGDGINDAPALARADVGIAMGTGTDVAIESAGITLLKGDLRGIEKAIRLKPRDDAEHSAEFIFRVRLQLARHSNCRRRALSLFRISAQPDHCRRGHESELRLCHRQCTAPSKN